MARSLKMDLHTHPIEALREKMGIKKILDINREVAAAIVDAIRTAGLDGIAITEHNNFNYGWVACLEIMDHFHRENLIVIPGTETVYYGQQFLTLYIPPDVRRSIPFFKGKEWFSMLAQPGYHHPLDLNQLSGLDYDAVEGESLHGEFISAEEVSRERKIPVIRASDARRLEDLGFRYIELESVLKGKTRRRH